MASFVDFITSAIKRPDGAIASALAQPTNIIVGAAKTLSDVKATLAGNPATASFLNSATTPVVAKSSPTQRGIPNILEGFASYTPLFTLACLKPEELNNPYLYRNSSFGLNQVVFSSAGRFDAARAATAYGAPEYFVNNFVMTSVITGSEGTGSSNAVSFSFEVYEPYSMGLFLQSLQVAATSAGYPNYLNDSVFVIMLEFVGYDDQGNMYSGGPKPKFFPLKLTNTSFSVTESGSNYKVEAVPYNHSGFSEVHNQTYNDISITGSTVKELLSSNERSLTTVLNEFEEKLVDKGMKGIPDVYEVHFPETSSTPIPGVVPTDTAARAVVNSSNQNVIVKSVFKGFDPTEFGDNTIGNASFNFQVDSGGNYVAPKAEDAYDEKTGKVDRDKVTIEAKTRTFQYAQGQTLTQIISQAILESDYAVKALSGQNFDSEGRINWFRLDCQIQLLEYDDVRQAYAKRIIYRVMPYKIHSSAFTNPGATPPGYGELMGSIVKQYNYVYTGQNNDLLKFDIQLNNTFYTAIAPTAPSEAGRVANQDLQSSGERDISKAELNQGTAGVSASASETGGRTVKPNVKAIKMPFGGSGNLTTEQVVANNFHLAFLQSSKSEMVSIDIETLGDPYWLVDSGLGGYFSGPGASAQVTLDNTANYESGDIYIYLRFRTPVEPKEQNGDYMFLGDEDSPFSGIYKVTQVESKFQDGTFKQMLKCVRMPLQPDDLDQPVQADKASAGMFNTEEKEKPAESPYEEDDATGDGTALA